MISTQAHKSETAERLPGIPGCYFGTDGTGLDHYYSTGSRQMTVVDGDETKTFKIPKATDGEKVLVKWAIHTIVEHDGKLWDTIRLDPFYADALTGRVSDEKLDKILEAKLAEDGGESDE